MNLFRKYCMYYSQYIDSNTNPLYILHISLIIIECDQSNMKKQFKLIVKHYNTCV